VYKTKDLQGKLNRLKNSVKPERLKSAQKAYLSRFAREKRGLMVLLGGLIVAESLLLVSLPVIMKYLVERDYNLFRLENLIADLLLLGGLVVVYLLLSFTIIRLGQELFFALINQIKRHWLIYFLQTPSAESSKLADGSLMAKLLYHTQLLRMGLERVLLEGGRAVVFYVIIVVAAFFFSSTTFFWLAMGFPLLCLATGVAWLIGRHYIRQEQTLNSRFIKVLFHQMNNLAQISSLGLGKERFHQLNLVIEQDTYFRKRRETWLKFSDRLIFALVILAGGMLYLIKDFYPILHWNNWTDGAVGIVLGGFFAKILIQCVHAGIFWQALQTGMQIAVPEFTIGKNPLGQGIEINFTKPLALQGSRVKLSKFGRVIKHFRLTLTPGSRTLIVGSGPVGKTTLAKFLCGLVEIPSINVKNAGRFLKAMIWCRGNKSRQLISLVNVYRESAGEFLLAKPAEDLDQYDLEKIFSRLKKYPQFEFIFKFKQFLGKRFDSLQGSLHELVLLQVAQAIVRRPKLICVDSSVYDLPGPEIAEALRILEQECPETTLVYFSAREDATAASFDQVMRLNETDFSIISAKNE
jgi:ABC-type multidrug transport system fused ATPase/permease subunit